ncbi:MAG TPA: hypothetical protein VMS22_16615 [Candidatus Eisenbacteria bacterium]|nr:hypothetical protein [Candidatus Eisenbacteria bacterium]
MSVVGRDQASAPVPTPVGAAPRAAPAVTEAVDLHALAPLAAWTRATQGDPAFRAVCAAAGVVPEAFSNGGGRLPLAQLETFLSALRDHVGGDGALLAAGTAGETRPVWPPRWLRSFATPGLLYRGRAGRKCVTAGAGRSAVHQRRLGATTIRYASTQAQSRLVCLWRQARLAQRPRAWGLPPAVVHETRCLARGDDACEYLVHWQAQPRWTTAIGVAAATSAGLAWSSVGPGIAWTLPAIAATVAQAIEIERVRRANRQTLAAFGTAFRRAAAAAPTRPAVADTEPSRSTPSPVPTDEAEAASLRREGDVWRISFASKTVLVRHSRGLSLLVHLLRNPGEEIHVSALDALSPSDAAMPTHATNVTAGEPVGDLGDAGEVLDAQAKATYRRRLVELREELAEAETCNDIGRAETLRAELEALVDQLRQATGLGGRDRRAVSNVDRVRVAVTRRIRAAIAQIEKYHEPLGAHLTATIHTGYFCSYGPGGVPWRE